MHGSQFFTQALWHIKAVTQAQKLIAFFALAIMAASTTEARSELIDTHSIPHFFNAEMQKPETFQITALGRAKFSPSEQLEFGTETLGLLSEPRIWTLYLKHLMFEEAHFQTAFSSFSLLLKSS
jgi:hypothetical protein